LSNFLLNLAILSSTYTNRDVIMKQGNYNFRCQQIHFKLASVLADMCERKLNQPEGSLLSRLQQLAAQHKGANTSTAQPASGFAQVAKAAFGTKPKD